MSSLSVLPSSLSPKERANFATGSRLLSCAINEELVEAIYIPYNNNSSAALNEKNSAVGVVFVLSPNFNKFYNINGINEISEISDENDNSNIFVIRVNHKPLFSSLTTHENDENKKEMMRINHINPWDILPSIFQIQIPLNHTFLYKSNDILNISNSYCYPFLNNLMDSEEKKVVVGPLEIWDILAKWLNLPKDLVEFFASELESSVKYQEYSYKNSKPIPSFNSTSVEWEQSLIESHPFHPLHKSRKAIPPLPDIEPGTYDFENPLIRFVSVSRDKVNILGSFEKKLLDLINIMSPKPNILSVDDNKILIPIHELQLPMIKEKFSYVEILPEKYSIRAKSFANLRTVIFPNLPKRSFKLPLAMRLTSAIRTISPWSAYLGTALLPILEKLIVNKNILRITYEKSCVISKEQDFDVAKHLACIMREDGVDDRDESEKVILGASLVERDENGSSVLEKVWNLDTEQKRIDFLDRYIKILFEAFLPPVIYNGFTFEPHLQNTRVRFNSKDRLLIGFIIRDYGGIRFHQETLFNTVGMRVEIIPGNSYESKDLYDVYDKLYHALIYNHVRLIVCSIHLNHSGIGWEIVRKHLSNIIPADHLLRKLWLEKTTSEGKCFLRMKFEGKFRDYIYRPIPNFILYKSEEEGITMECSPKIN
ncbi:hypothetical protein Glove_417g64 [Diversispora epigaea]|uniref:Aerobactin siderophore biosynthesis IucA/IucC N-terminal domain-containing protein n=1 Tax=Diversispora epigaea TaxID=1348612 RepID=A0A397H4F8_9GLOM|nr:hypothetical protein Glove_417g64 [Diversispora epigaea]